jgi:hypothetical protein
MCPIGTLVFPCLLQVLLELQEVAIANVPKIKSS